MKNKFKISLLTIIACFPVFINAQNEKYSGGNGDGFTSASFENKGAPGSFAAAAGVNAIQLTWQQNTGSDNVIIAFNTTDSFGDPSNGSSYSVNDALSGGGTILFNGSGTSYLHTGLSATTTYYYKAWSVSGTTYSTNGVTDNATTQTLAAKYSGGNGDGFASNSFENKGAPGSFTAGAGVSVIQLTWQQNTDKDNVMVASNTSNSFGTPSDGSTYSVNDALAGGGTIIFNGSGTSYLHTGLNTTTTYYYTAWSVSGTTYSTTEVTANAVTQTLDAKYSGGDGDGSSSAVSGAIPLPVELISFEGVITEDGVLLTWETATEVNNYGFQVERRNLRGLDTQPADSNLEGYTAIGFVPGHGNSASPKKYEFIDASPFGETPPSEALQYRLKQIDTDGAFTYYNQIAEVNTAITGVEESPSADGLPTEYSLSQNYPNPFNPATTIQYSIPATVISNPNEMSGEKSSRISPFGRNDNVQVTLKIYDILGNEAATLVNNHQPPGRYKVEFNASSLSSGMYFYKLEAGSFSETKKMLLIK